MRKRRAFTLIELLTALGLLSVMLASLFFWTRQLTVSRAQQENAVWPSRLCRYADQRLTQTLPKATGSFCTQEGALIFTFDNGPHPDPALSGEVLGKLYLSDHGALCLGIWPKDAPEPAETHVLLKDVEELTFSFYYPPQTRLQVNPDQVGKATPKELWQSTWELEYATLPAMMQLSFVYREEKQTFGYDFDAHPIVYWGSA